MGTRKHEPPHPPAVPETGHVHESEGKSLGPGVRPGTRSLVLEARKRIMERQAALRKGR